MSLQGLVDATATALGGARDMYGPAATATGLPSTAGLQSLKTDLSAAVDSVPTTWRGDGGEGYKQSGGNGVAALDNVIGADGRVVPQVVTASTDSRDGRSGMNTVVSDTRNGVNAIAPRPHDRCRESFDSEDDRRRGELLESPIVNGCDKNNHFLDPATPSRTLTPRVGHA